MYQVTYRDFDWTEVYECASIQAVAVTITDLVNRKGYDESLFVIAWVN